MGIISNGNTIIDNGAIEPNEVDLTSMVTGTLPAANGGTGVTSADEIGNLVLLNTVTTTDATVSDIDFSSTYITSTYDNYVVFVTVAPATDNTQLRFRFFVGGSLKTGGSDYQFGFVDEGGNGTNSGGESYIRISPLGIGNASGEGVTTVVYLANPTSSTKPSTISFNTQSRNTAGAHSMIVGGGAAAYNLVNNGISFFWNAGNFASGSTISLYGVKQ